MQSAGGGNMNAAQLARLQQQLAQYGRGQPGQQQQMMNANAMGGMGNQQQQLQQAYMQQQQLQQGGQQAMNARRNSLLGGNAMAMLQQQQQGNNQMANANLNYLNAFNQGGPSGAMDASSASGAQLAALAGINMGGNNNMQNQAANNMLLGNRQTSQTQMPAQQMQQAVGQLGGQSNNAALLQQQIAQLQRQLEQQQQTQNQNQGMGMSGAMGGMPGQRRASSSSGQNFGGMPSQQQQLLQQMQQMGGGNSDQFSSMAAMMQGQNPSQLQQPQQTRNQMGGSLGGLNNQQDLLLQQQRLMGGNAGMNQNSMQNDMFSNNQSQSGSNSNDLMGGRGRSSQMMQMEQMNQSMNSQSQNNNTSSANNNNNALGNSFNNFDMDGSTNSRASRQQVNNPGITPLDLGAGQVVGDTTNKDDAANQKSFLDGSFAGGWQSNADLPDRRRIIFSILEVIRQMRPDTNKISQKLPHMAKSLEEHLYRSAQTKEEYLDPSTLKKRLQLIAHGLELHRSTTSTDPSGNDQSGNNSVGNIPSESQQLQQYLQMQGGNVNLNQGNAISRNSITSLGGMAGSGNNRGAMDDMSMQGSLGGNNFGNSGTSGLEDLNDPVAQQKKKVIRQQQQRLLLLRHASKCKEGQNCKTKFCPQMMALWKHMKKCRDKNCKTPHCLSSRCVLNHYRICKSQGRTATCEVCGPVMEQIKLSEQLDSSDPLAAVPQSDMPQLQQQISNFGNPQQQQQQQQNQLNTNAQARQQQAMQQLYQKQQQAIQQNQNQQMPNMMGMQNNMQGNLQNDMSNNMQNNMQGGNNLDVLNSLGGGVGLGSNDLQGSQNSNQLQQQQQNQGNQQQNHQNLQAKLQQQQHVLRQLQKQQSNLLEQQQQLQEQQQLLKDPGTQQGQQLQQQSLLLQQLQRRCQQEQAIIQQELLVTMKGMQGGQLGNQALGNTSQNSQMLNNNSQNSHHSQQNQMGMHGGNSQNNQMNVQAQMQALSQSHLDAVNTNNKSNDDMNQMDSLQNQLNSDPLKNDLLNQPLPDDSPGGDDKDDDLDQDLDNDKSNDVNGSSSSDPFDSMGPLVTDTSENKDDTSGAPKVRSAPILSRGKGARGRGGKGKRLRDIADDLLPAESAAVVRAGGSIAIPSDSSRKRSADDSGEDGPSSKSQKTDDDKDDLNPSLTSSMPKGDVEQNLMMLHKGLHLTSRTITHKCLPIVQQLIDDPYGWVFRDAVDPVVFGLPDYFEVVKNPMHLLLVKKKLENAVYTDMASFERDVKLVFENAILYNGEDSEVGQLAHTMMGVFEKEYQKVCEGVKTDLQPSKPPRPAPVDNVPCKICRLQRRQLEPPALYCASLSCEAPRIKRNATYYTYGSNQNCWCEKCYDQLNPKKLITLDDGNDIRKSRLLKSKNDSLPEECWIECDDCHCRVHQICALYNGRIAKPNSVFRCSECEKKRNINVPKNMGSRAADLPKCSMSVFIEQGLRRTLTAAYEKAAGKNNCSLEQIDKVEGLTVRVMSHIDKKHLIREEMFKRYERIGCPSDYPVHTKCVGLFQSFDGIDVLLFAMYVYEYGDDCPAPNRRRVYVSYLDSVQYFQPSQYRSIVYQSVIVEYLRFVKKRGFHTAHIWSCPPAAGDEYVFFCHPSHQKIPQEEKLRNWYYQTLDTAKAEGIVVETTDYYDEYFNNNGKDAPIGYAPNPLSLPYFEGDYVPGEIEKILTQMTKEERKPVMPPPKAAQKRSGSKRGTRSNPGSLVNQYPDKVMLRLGQTIYNMKENFIIARLRNKRFVAASDRGEDLSNWPDDDAFKPPGKDSHFNGMLMGDMSDDESDDERQALLAQKLAEAVRSSGKIGSTVEADDQFESELFENRQLFLNYCQTNHFQFDQLRRAKHTSMMVLYQLHNPLAPKFVPRCGVCYRDIANGARYHCNNCASYDLCQECYGPVTNGSWANRGSRFSHDSNHTFSKVLTENTGISQEQQAERTKAMKPFLLILVHAAGCPGSPQCNLLNCRKMKQLFAHVKTCDQTHKKGCKICIRMLALILVHARSCTIRGSCPLPFCDRIRERNERLRRQQQLMDDRRRNAQNEFYQQED